MTSVKAKSEIETFRMTMQRGSDVILLQVGDVGPSERNLMKMVSFLGGTTRIVKLNEEGVQAGRNLGGLMPPGSRLLASAQTITKLMLPGVAGMELLSVLMEAAESIFVYGFGPGSAHEELLKFLTAGAIVGVNAPNGSASRIKVANGCRDVCRQLSGISFAASSAIRQPTFQTSSGPSVWEFLLSAEEKPFLLRFKSDRGQVFLLAGDQIADLDSAVARDSGVLDLFCGVTPVFMFLQASSPDGFWHNQAPRACFIIDDPPLKQRYGFLEYRKLLDLMKSAQFCTSVAFIPWNFRRTDPETANLFTSHPRQYSLAVHGCDHTSGEFGITDHDRLCGKSQLALDRMRHHAGLSGVAFDEVMVFPQGIFSTAAIEALKLCGYLAAVNSTPYPVDSPNVLTVKDVLDVTVSRFSNFPLFMRRNPEKIAELAFDLFLGKPALLVEHHGCFQNGYDALGSAIEKLNALDPRLEWSNLASICSQASLVKTAENGDIHVRCFTDRFFLRNTEEHPRKYLLFRQAGQGTPQVLVDGKQAVHALKAGTLQIEILLAPGQAAEIEVRKQGSDAGFVPQKEGALYRTKVLIRRNLSEFRDNYLDKSKFLSKSARTAMAMTNSQY